MAERRALIFGVSGQDGAYLAQRLLGDGYQVYGTSRDRELANLANLRRLGIAERITLLSASLVDFRSVLQAISDVRPTEIYNLSGQSSVGLSFNVPVETFDGIVVGTLNILESIRFLKSEIRLYNACSSEVFGDVSRPADEETPFRPRSPYAVAKAAAYWAVANYREAYGLFACSGLLFNHESPLRPARFVTRKIVQGAVEIAQGRAGSLELGNLDVSRDWGWAPEYVHAMALMLQRDAPEDFIIATGKAASLEDFVDRAFNAVGLNWREHVRSDPSLRRPSDLSYSVGRPAKAESELGWTAQTRTPDVVDLLVKAELEALPAR
jgi:GDPmannose 4,6-dehydratase